MIMVGIPESSLMLYHSSIYPKQGKDLKWFGLKEKKNSSNYIKLELSMSLKDLSKYDLEKAEDI